MKTKKFTWKEINEALKHAYGVIHMTKKPFPSPEAAMHAREQIDFEYEFARYLGMENEVCK